MQNLHELPIDPVGFLGIAIDPKKRTAMIELPGRSSARPGTTRRHGSVSIHDGNRQPGCHQHVTSGSDSPRRKLIEGATRRPTKKGANDRAGPELRSLSARNHSPHNRKVSWGRYPGRLSGGLPDRRPHWWAIPVAPKDSANRIPLGVRLIMTARRSPGSTNRLAKPSFSMESATLVMAAVVTPN
ncbi:MAG: hypothetical protein RLZZ214_3260 [Verrucomicrobiota bacterium]